MLKSSVQAPRDCRRHFNVHDDPKKKLCDEFVIRHWTSLEFFEMLFFPYVERFSLLTAFVYGSRHVSDCLIGKTASYNFYTRRIKQQSLCRSLGLREVETPRISRQWIPECGKVVSLTHRPSSNPPRRYFWYSFLLEAASTPGSYCFRKDLVNEKSK